MSKTKNHPTYGRESMPNLHRFGMLLVAATTALGVVDAPDQLRSVIMPAQPILAGVNISTEVNNSLRREGEETAPHYVSYAETQRTASRSGRL